MARRRRQSYRYEFPAPEDKRAIDPCEQDALPLLETAEITGGHRMPFGSNYTFLVWLDAGPGKYMRAIYKPRDGERPLWDFPRGSLYKRERAAYLLSRLLGWPNIPLTLVREGPYGVGMFQRYVECDPDHTYFEMANLPECQDELLKIMAFDLITNNADRKGGHCLADSDGRIWSIDHGLTFHPSFKLRTVMMEFWGTEIPQSLIADLGRLRRKLTSRSEDTAELRDWLSGPELKALDKRIRFALREPVIPNLDPYGNVPWPFV